MHAINHVRFLFGPDSYLIYIWSKLGLTPLKSVGLLRFTTGPLENRIWAFLKNFSQVNRDATFKKQRLVMLGASILEGGRREQRKAT